MKTSQHLTSHTNQRGEEGSEKTSQSVPCRTSAETGRGNNKTDRERARCTLPLRPTVAVVGGGQLARMMQESAIALGITLKALVEENSGSTGQVVVDKAEGAADDAQAVQALVESADVLTFEHEHVPQEVLKKLPDMLSIQPPPSALLFAQNKLEMRRRMTELGIPCPQWAEIRTQSDAEAFGQRVGWPLIVKTPVGGYDGHGVLLAASAQQVGEWLKGYPVLLAEERVTFRAELAVLLARRPSGQMRSWPVSQTIQDHGICSVVRAPAPGLDPQVALQAQEIGETIAQELGVTGVLAVEMFLIEDEEGQHVLVNELAMRPHNSGHWTIDGAVTSQFEQHLRAAMDLPLGETAMRAPATVMVNLLGSDLSDPSQGLPAALEVDPRVRIHLYGKSVRPGRKLGHVNVCADTTPEAEDIARAAVNALQGTPKHSY